jgi:hypothetical protein
MSDVYVGQGSGTILLNSTTQTVVASVLVPPGNYFISASVPVSAAVNSIEQGNCTLSTAPVTPSAPNYGSAFIDLQLGTANTDGHIAVIGTGSFAVNSTISVSCGGHQWLAINPGIIAIKVGAVH